MKRHFAAATGAVAALGALALLLSGVCAAQERVAPPGDDGAGSTAAPPAPRHPAGMVRFPGGTARIGIDRKELAKVIERTEVGRMHKSIVEKAIEEELSVSTPEWTIDLAPFWVAKFETTAAQYQEFLRDAAKTSYTVPPAGEAGDNTLDQISRRFLLSERFQVVGGGWHYPVAVDWRGLYDLNMDTLNPLLGPDGKPLDPATRPAPETFRDKPLPPGTKIVCYRYSVPTDWKDKGRLRATAPPGRESHPVTLVTLVDALACARFYGNHIPTEVEWEAAARGPGGAIYPEGKEFLELAHAWKGFSPRLEVLQASAKNDIKVAKARLEKAKEGGDATAIARAEAEVADLQALLAMKPFPDPLDPLRVEVGMFPRGRSPCGAEDMIGNVDEWVSTPLVPWPGTDSRSSYLAVDASIFKGGNIIERDTLLMVPFRRFFANGPIRYTYKSSTGGFRMARYEMPGASVAAFSVREVNRMEPPVLPRERDRRTHEITGPTLQIEGAAGIHRVVEVPWQPDQPADRDPPGKVFHLGRAEAVCVVPASGTPFRDPGAIRNAASANAPKQVPEGTKVDDKRRPRDIPFLGLLVLSEGIEIKADGVETVEIVEIPLTAEELKEAQDRRDAQKKAAEDAGKEPEPDDKKDGGGEEKKEKAVGPQDGKGGKKGGDKGGKKDGDKGGKKDGDKGGKKDGDKGGKPAEGGAPAPADPAPEGEAAEEPKPEEPEEPPLPTTKQVRRIVYKAGPIAGRDHPQGLLLGLLKVGDDPCPVLWRPRLGVVGSLEPGGTVLLEQPYAYLPKDAIALKKVSRPGVPWSRFEDEVSGEVRLVFYVSVEGKGDPSKRDAIEVTLTLNLRQFPGATPNAPWVSTQTK